MNCHALDKFVRHFQTQGPVVLLESQSPDHPAAVCSYLAACPQATIKAWSDKIEIQSPYGATPKVFTSDPWDALQAFQNEWGDWLFGYLGYDLKNYIEKGTSGNPDRLNAPDLFFMVPGVLIKYDLLKDKISTIKGERPPMKSTDRPGQEAVRISDLQSNVSQENYVECIRQAQQHIFEGTYYEINLSHQLQGNFRGDPFQLYKKMRSKGPVPFGSFISMDEFSVCSLSPERFLCKKGDVVYSQPIKGTTKRDPDLRKDEALKQALIESSKERAENLMIVDLVRNDLSRISQPGSVQVSSLFEVQTFGTVHQMVSTVQAQSNTTNPFEIIKACYPMGSMTGAPKISAIQWIEKMESYKRGIYSGAIGYITPSGDFDFNVVIRTAIIKDALLCYAAGGAITSDSNPLKEWQETLLKAKALTASISH